MSDGKTVNSNFTFEESGINIENENSLHSSLKKWFSEPNDRLEAKVGKYIVDILRGDQIIEVQTRNFASIRSKLWSLVKNHPVTLIHPIASEKWLVYLADGGIVSERRKSSKRGKPENIFQEIMYIPNIINHHNFSLLLVMTKEEEIRKRDGKGAWRRKRISIKDRMLLDVEDTMEFHQCIDFLQFLPSELENPFTNKELASVSGMRMRDVYKMTWSLRKMGALRVTGKKGNAFLMERATDQMDWECWE
jgi:hypothetical protein